jgi:hypothetical protein
MHVHQYLALYEHVAEQADEPQAIEQAQALQSAMDAGDRPTIELFAVERCHDD